ncbi:NDxxF motif lipoprotein [Staphylococcus saprophyticus]|nr:NDxxF motif lipoprotein [Staphylococcus saprophyticus]MDW3829199.1 NDxxF motif lipoprotein [Staphylococcus saprophyticus]MDW4426192.1 NDxxF motif lipoprotein [Staphylococcus saprophyticus]
MKIIYLVKQMNCLIFLKKVFSNNNTNEDISEKDIKKNLKTYLDTFDSLEKNASHIRNKEELTEEDKKSLKNIHNLVKKNNANFKHYISNNNLPKNYEHESFKIYKHLNSVELLLNEIYNNAEKAMDNDSSNKEKLKASEKIKKVNAEYKDKVNDKKEKEIKEFLNEKNIKTNAFK